MQPLPTLLIYHYILRETLQENIRERENPKKMKTRKIDILYLEKIQTPAFRLVRTYISFKLPLDFFSFSVFL